MSSRSEPLVYTAEASSTAVKSCLDELWRFFSSELLPQNEDVEWDHVRIELWMDSGRIIVFPASSKIRARVELSACQVVFPSMLKDYEILADSSMAEVEFTKRVCDLERMWVEMTVDAAKRQGLSELRVSFWSSDSETAIYDEFFG